VKRLITVVAILIAAILFVVWRLSREAPPREAAGEGAVNTSGAPVTTRPAPRGEPKRPVPVFDETAALRAQVSELLNEREAQKKLQQRECVTSISSKCPFLTPSQEVLREMARCAVVRADMPLVPSPQSPDQDNNVPPEVVEVNRRFWGEKRAEFQQLYGELLGKPAPPDDFEKLLDEIRQAVPITVTDDVQRRIARERAGLPGSQPPRDLAGLSPAERFWRKRLSFGDDYETALAQKLGAVRARTLRAEGDGWPMKALYSGSCDPPAPADRRE
jgi:hypothetical protein